MKHIIIGVGAAGITAAKTIRANDKNADITMISIDEHVHSRCMLHKYISQERDECTLSFIPEDFFRENKITWFKKTLVQSIDTDKKFVLLEGGQTLSYDKLLITTGANSFIPPVGDFRKAKNVFGLRNLSDAQAINELIKPDSKVLIVGSGLVGLDAAYAMLERGIDVTVVEMADRILPIQLDETASSAYQKLFENAGCKFILNKKAAETTMNEKNKITEVRLDDGTAIVCDIVIVAAGVRSAIACTLNSAIQGEQSIKVNEFMETNCKDIYAAGDVTGLSGIWPNAMNQGKLAALNMCGKQVPYEDQYAMKNTINFFGLPTLSLGRGQAQEGDEVLIWEDRFSYRKAIIRNNKLNSILLQGKIDYSGIYQYLIKNQIDLSTINKNVFSLTFADFYGISDLGEYEYQPAI